VRQRSLAADLNLARVRSGMQSWSNEVSPPMSVIGAGVVPFVGRRRAGCLIAAISLADVNDLVTETCWALLSDFSELAASIIEPIVD
jgi:hypothetical protein